MNVNSARRGTYVGSFVNLLQFTLNADNRLYTGSYDKPFSLLN